MNQLFEWIENYKTSIGLILVASILFGGMLLLRPQEVKSSIASTSIADKRIEELEKTVSQLTERVNVLSQSTEIETPTASAENTTDIEKPKQTKPETVKKSEPSTSTIPNGKININKATLTELDSLPGIGPTYAKRIIDYREANNGFKSLEELMEIKGIGEKTFSKLKDQIIL